MKSLSAISRFFGYATLSTTGAKVLIETTVQKYLFGYEDNIFNMIGNVQQMFSDDNKKLPTEFGILKKVKCSISIIFRVKKKKNCDFSNSKNYKKNY